RRRRDEAPICSRRRRGGGRGLRTVGPTRRLSGRFLVFALVEVLLHPPPSLLPVAHRIVPPELLDRHLLSPPGVEDRLDRADTDVVLRGLHEVDQLERDLAAGLAHP